MLRDYNGLKKSISEGKLGFPLGKTIFGCTAVIIGFGNIGRELAKRLVPFNVIIHAIVNSLESFNKNRDENHNLLSSAIEIENWPNISKSVDIVFICCPLTKQNKGMIDAKFLSNLKSGSVLINIARVSSF